MSHTTFLLHGRHSTAKEWRLGAIMAAPAGNMQATGLPHPTISPHTLQQPSHTQQPQYLQDWVENTQFWLA